MTRLRWWILLLLATTTLETVAGCGAKTGLDEPDAETEFVEADVEEVVDLPPTVLCLDDELWSAPGKLTVVEARGEDAEGDVTYEWSMRSAPTGSTSALHPLHTSHTTLTPDMLGEYVVQADVRDTMGNYGYPCQTRVHSVANPPTALCPPDVTDARVGVAVTLEGEGDDVDGTIVGFEWSVRSQPEGSHPTLIPPDDASTAFTADVEGEYEIRFEVIDDMGYRGQCLVHVTALGAPPLDCPEEEYSTRTRRPFAIPAIPVLNGEAVTWRWELLSWPPESTGPAPTPPDAASPSITPDKPGRYVLRATATNARGLSSECEVTVNATPSGPDAYCPGEACTVPLNTITLTGNGADDGTIVAYHWELTAIPEGSAADPPSPADGATTSFMPDLAGRFTITLTVQDDDGNRADCSFDVVAVPSEGLRVEMYWNPPDRSCSPGGGPPGCDGTDVDLHLLHPLATTWVSGLDCYYGNCNASYGVVLEWDVPGPADNPRLDLDDVEGHGPENINIDDPVIGHEYLVGVHYYDEAGWGPSQVHVRIYCASVSGGCESGAPVDFGPVALTRGGNMDMSRSDFWRVAAITWNGTTCAVRSLANADGTPNIITHGAAQTGR